jgi:hypothetical protein
MDQSVSASERPVLLLSVQEVSENHGHGTVPATSDILGHYPGPLIRT